MIERGFILKNIPSIIINNLVLFASFVFTDISVFIGIQLDSAVGVMLIITTVVYLLMILTTVLAFQAIIDKKIWECLYRVGLLEREQKKIAIILDMTFICLSLPLSLMASNCAISRLMNNRSVKLQYNLLFVILEVFAYGLSCLYHCYYIRKICDGENRLTVISTNENIPLFFKNVIRNKSKMMLVVSIISFGMVVFNSILFIIKCDNSMVYIDKAISVDYFLTACDTRSEELRNGDQTIRESDISFVEENDAYKEGGRLYHSVEPVAALKTDLLPEVSQFSITYGVPIEKNELGDYYVNLYGADDFVFNNMELYEGNIDLDQLSTGQYVIYGLSRNAGSLEYVDDVSDKWKYFEVGDEVTIVGDDSAKQYTIMAICKVNHTYAEQHEYNYPGHEVIFYLPAFEYLNYAKSTEKGEIQPMRYLFNTTDSQNIDDELQGVRYESKRQWEANYKREADEIVRGTLLFAIGCAVIGLFVFINTMIISYLDRQKEFEILGNIGMTSHQINFMILAEGETYGIIISSIIAVSVWVVEALGSVVLVGESWIYRITVSPLLICIATISIVSMLIPCIVYKVTKKRE